jgi:hypothetical protein
MNKAGFAVLWFAIVSALGAETLPTDRWTVPVQGFYRIDAEGTGEANLSIVGRAAGEVGSIHLVHDLQTWKGSTGLILEPGDYEVRWTKAAGVTAQARVQAFSPVNAPSVDKAPELKEGDSIRTSLADGQSLVYKLVIPPDQPHVNIELRGRDLSAVVLWKDGAWDQGITISSARLMSQPGRPSQFFELDRDLEAGSYVLVAVGGPRVDWGDSEAVDPFYISRGRSDLPLGAVREGKLDAEGRAEFWSRAGTTVVEAEFPDAVDASVAVATGRLNLNGTALKAKDPVRVVQTRVYDQRWVVLQGPAGAKFRVRALTSTSSTMLPSSDGGVLLSSSASAEENDGLPLTALAVLLSGGNPQLIFDRTLPVDDDNPLHFAFDAQSASSVFVRVKTAGSYTVVENPDRPGAAEYQFDLLDDLISTRNYKGPLLARNGKTVELQAKIYRISTTAVKLGRCEWVLTKAGLFSGMKASSLWAKPLSGGGLWTVVLPPVAYNQRVQLFVSSRGSVPSSVGVVGLPAVAGNLPVLSLDAGQTVQLPLKFSDGVWRGWTGATVLVDGAPLAVGGATKQGNAVVAVTSPKGGLFETQAGPPPGAPLPPLPEKIPVGKVFWEDWTLGQTRVYELEVTKPGMYRCETLGRLSCELRVRTPLHRDLFMVSKNGGGTNALLSTYLAPGLYRVEMRVVDRTFGRAGVILAAADDPIERTLVTGVQARATVPAQRFLKVNLTVGKDGRYLLTSLGLNQDFIRRFEDAQGYPVAAPLESGSPTFSLAAGTYTIWSYPMESESRRAYGLELISNAEAADDQPGRLSWNRYRDATWKETPDRTPQVYSLTAEAPLRAQIVLTEGMVWQLRGADGTVLDQGPGGDPVEVSIPKGDSSVAVRSQAVDNLKDYRIGLVTLDLTPGRAIVFPGAIDVPLAVGHAGTYELMTWGNREVVLTLTNEDGTKVLSRGVPRTDDWNTSITVALPAGRYRAQIRDSASPTPRAPTVNQDQSDQSDQNESDSDEPSAESDDGGSGDSDADDSEGAAPDRHPRTEAWSPWNEARYPGDAGAAPLLMFRERMERKADPMVAAGGGSEVWDAAIVSRTFTTKDAGVYQFGSDAGQLAVFRLARGGKVLAQSAGGFLIPLPAQTTYQLSTWWEDGTNRPVTLSVGPAAVATWASPSGLSGRVPGAVLASSAWEEPLQSAPDGWLTPKDGVWWTDGAGSTATPTPVVLASGDQVSVPVGEYGQAVKLTVAPGSVGLLQARGNGSAVGLSVQPAVTSDWEWKQALVTDRVSLVGAGPGEYVGRLWDPEGGPVRWADLSWNTYPASAAGAGSGTLAPGTAALVKGTGALRFVLDAGLIAVPLSGGRPLTADSGPVTGVLGGGNWAVVNPGDKPAMWRADPASADDEPSVTDKTPWERSLTQASDLTVNVKGSSGSHVYVSVGGADEIRWGDAASGLWERSKKTVLPTGEWLEWPRSQGTLFLKGVTGWIRVVSAASPPTTPAALGFTGKTAPLPSEGGALSAAQQWTFRAAQAGFYAVSAPGGGVLSVWQGGTPLSSSWSADRRIVLVKLAAGEAVVGARSFDGAATAGTVTVRPLAAQTGEALLSPGEAQLWPVAVKAAGRVGLALNADSEEPRLWLFGPDFHLLGQGRLFWRTLAPGTYWLVVEGGEHTVRYRPVLLGLEGSRLGVPDDVQAQFLGDTSLSQGQSE